MENEPLVPLSILRREHPVVIADLTARERQVLALLVQGYGIDDMANTLFISRNYVYLLIRQLRARFLAKTNAAVVARALALGILSPEGEYPAR